MWLLFFFSLQQSLRQVTGDTVYNMLRLAEVECDADERPLNPHKIRTAEVLLRFYILDNVFCRKGPVFHAAMTQFLSSRFCILLLMTSCPAKQRKQKRKRTKRTQRNLSQKPQSERSDFLFPYFWNKVCCEAAGSLWSA